MDSDYSDTESISSSISESMQTTDLYDSLVLGKDQKAYKLDKNCTICNAKFGKVGLIHARKHYCKFCYRGVCAQCSPQNAIHPVQLKRLRVCNACCQKAVINKYTENFRLDIDHVLSQQDQVKEEISKSKQEQTEIEERIKEVQRLYEEEMSMELKFIKMKKEIFELENETKKKAEVRDSLMVKQINAKLELDTQDKNIKNLQTDFKDSQEKSKKIKEDVKNLRTELGDKQDAKVELIKKIEDAKIKEQEIFKQKKDFEKIEKSRKELKDAEDLVRAEQKTREEVLKETKSFQEENKKIEQEIERKKSEPKEDPLIGGSKEEFRPEDEEKISELRKVHREKAAKIENLKIQLVKLQPKKEDPLDIEHTTIDKTRPCVRCISF